MATVHHQTYFKCAAVLQGQKKIISNSHVQSERDTGQVNLSQLRAIETEHVIEEKKKTHKTRGYPQGNLCVKMICKSRGS